MSGVTTDCFYGKGGYLQAVRRYPTAGFLGEFARKSAALRQVNPVGTELKQMRLYMYINDLYTCRGVQLLLKDRGRMRVVVDTLIICAVKLSACLHDRRSTTGSPARNSE